MTRIRGTRAVGRGRRTLLVMLTILAGGAAMLTGCGSAGGAGASEPPQSFGQSLDAPLPAAVTHSRLTTSDGRPISLADLRGKVVVVSDFMTLCQEICPMDTGNIVAAARKVDKAGLGDKVVFLSITIDPTRDDTAQLAAYRNLFSPAPANWLTVTGSAANLSSLWQTLGVFIQKVPDQPPLPKNWLTGKPLTYDLTHSDEVFFFDGKSSERFLLNGRAHLSPGAPMPPTLRHFLDAQGVQNLTRPDDQSWTVPQVMQVLSWLTGQKLT